MGSSDSTAAATGVVQQIDDGTYLTDFQTQQVLDFIDETCDDAGSCTRPFFVMLSTSAPHDPATPAPKYQSLYTNFLYRERAWGELPDGDVSDKPEYVVRSARDWVPDEDDPFHRDQLRSLRSVDAGISQIRKKLVNKGLLSNTIIVFTSDNGLMWGEHTLTDKHKPYEESVRLPLIAMVPGVAPRVEDRLVAVDLDLPATILEWAGVSADYGDGRSLVPLIQDDPIVWRNELLLQHFNYGAEGGSGVPTWAAVRADDWKYVEYVTGEVELYDLMADPYELTSLHADPAYQEIKADLAQRLDGLGRGLAITKDNLQKPKSASNDLPKATQGRAYSTQFSAWGGDGSYAWELYADDELCAGSALPAGLTLSPQGQLAGTPAASGNWRFCIRVSDGTRSPQPGNDRVQSYVMVIDLAVAASQ